MTDPKATPAKAPANVPASVPASVPESPKSRAAQAREAREIRRAAALRANLGRRKEQTRARAEDGGGPRKPNKSG